MAHGAACWGGTRTHRNPLFLFLFSGSSLSRFAERRFWGELSNEPPRTTRLPVFRACRWLLCTLLRFSPTAELPTDAVGLL